MTEKIEEVLDGDKKEDWMNAKWRPAMGWMYMLVCLCDFVVFPVLWSIYHAILHTGVATQWQPLTLQGAGLFHLAMGAIIGVAAFGRTQEKIAGANNGGLQMPAMGGGFGGNQGGFGNSPQSGFGGTSGGFGTTTAAPMSRPNFGNSAPAAPGGFGGGFNKPSTATSSCGRAMPAPQEDEPL